MSVVSIALLVTAWLIGGTALGIVVGRVLKGLPAEEQPCVEETPPQLAEDVSGHGNLPSGGHGLPAWRPPHLPPDGQLISRHTIHQVTLRG